MPLKGLILKGIGGFYYVETERGIYECPARGKFRKEKITPYAGDHVEIEAGDDFKGVVTKIMPRKNYLIRPPVANIDNLFIAASLKAPVPNRLMIDKTIAAAELKEIEPIMLITKLDLDGSGKKERMEESYRKAGISCITVSVSTGEGLSAIAELLAGRISAFTGNSGVGKSTLLNKLFPQLKLRTGEISDKLGRGRHTTREVELFPLEKGGYVADTPGFSTFDIEKYDMTEKENLVYGFREFIRHSRECRFSTCTHTGEKGCRVLQAVQDGDISKSRYNSYLEMYQEIKDRKPWMANKNV